MENDGGIDDLFGALSGDEPAAPQGEGDRSEPAVAPTEPPAGEPAQSTSDVSAALNAAFIEAATAPVEPISETSPEPAAATDSAATTPGEPHDEASGSAPPLTRRELRERQRAIDEDGEATIAVPSSSAYYAGGGDDSGTYVDEADEATVALYSARERDGSRSTRRPRRRAAPADSRVRPGRCGLRGAGRPRGRDAGRGTRADRRGARRRRAGAAADPSPSCRASPFRRSRRPSRRSPRTRSPMRRSPMRRSPFSRRSPRWRRPRRRFRSPPPERPRPRTPRAISSRGLRRPRRRASSPAVASRSTSSPPTGRRRHSLRWLAWFLPLVLVLGGLGFGYWYGVTKYGEQICDYLGYPDGVPAAQLRHRRLHDRRERHRGRRDHPVRLRRRGRRPRTALRRRRQDVQGLLRTAARSHGPGQCTGVLPRKLPAPGADELPVGARRAHGPGEQDHEPGHDPRGEQLAGDARAALRADGHRTRRLPIVGGAAAVLRGAGAGDDARGLPLPGDLRPRRHGHRGDAHQAARRRDVRAARRSQRGPRTRATSSSRRPRSSRRSPGRPRGMRRRSRACSRTGSRRA